MTNRLIQYILESTSVQWVNCLLFIKFILFYLAWYFDPIHYENLSTISTEHEKKFNNPGTGPFASHFFLKNTFFMINGPVKKGSVNKLVSLKAEIISRGQLFKTWLA